MDDTGVITANYLLYFLLPMWVLPGLLDYYLHRRSRIETTSGLPESCVHLAAITIIGVPILLGLLFEINALTLLLMFAAFLIHVGTSLWDVAYASERREVTFWEHHVHSYLEVLPFTVLSFVIVLHWNTFLTLFGAGPEQIEFRLTLKETPINPGYVRSVLLGCTLLLVGPYVEEVWRCWRAKTE